MKIDPKKYYTEKIIFIRIFYPNNLNFQQKKSQNNSLFRLFFKVPHFEEVTPDKLVYIL